MTIENANTIGELSDFMKSEFDIDVDGRMDFYKLDATKTYLTEITDMINEFPELGTYIQSVGKSVDGAYAGMDDDGNLALKMSVMRDLERANKRYADDVKKKYHPEGTNATQIISHELGHALENILLGKRYTPGTSDYDKAYANSEMAKEILGKAMDRVSPGWRRFKFNRPAREAMLGISLYATSDASEAMAEAVADYRANGERAKPLSVEIWRELKNRF